MKKHLLPEEGQFYKVNLHCHSTFSDGKLTIEEIKELYKANGYSAVAFTDHDVFIPHPELNDEEFIALHGYEMEVNEVQPEGANPREKRTCHMCFVALDPNNDTAVCWHRSKYMPTKSAPHAHLVKFDPNEPDYERVYSHEGVSDMMRRGREAGFFVTYNHPTWSLENYPEYIGYEGMHAMEVVNCSSSTLGFAECNERVYDDILRSGKRIYAVCTDDNHSRVDTCGAFTVVKAPCLSYRAITDALVKGNFYASEAPEIKSLCYEDGKVTVETSPASLIRITTSCRRAGRRVATEESGPLTSAEFTLAGDEGYFRITVTDANGKSAYTSAYFLDELV